MTKTRVEPTMTLRMTREQLIEALEERRPWAEQLDARNLAEHQRAEADFLKQFRAACREAAKWTYEEAKEHGFNVGLNGNSSSAPSCPRSVSAQLDAAIRWAAIRWARADKRVRVTLRPDNSGSVHWLLTHDENAPKRGAVLMSTTPASNDGEAWAAALVDVFSEEGYRDPPSGVDLISLERMRQLTVEGWTHEHDQDHHGGDLASAAVAYIACTLPLVDPECGWSEREAYGVVHNGPMPWPFDAASYKPSTNPVRNLVRAGALIAAEIDRIQRRAVA